MAHTVATFIAEYHDEILNRWRDLWDSIQRRRPESHFPDPPYEDILGTLPYTPAVSMIPEAVLDWFARSPVFCTGAGFCQLHVCIASVLLREQVPERAELLAETEASLDALILDAGTRKWVSALLADTHKQEAVHSERLAVIGQLAAGVAHEIGNPLTSISSIVQVLQRRTEDPFFTEQLGHVKKSIDRIARIVRELVDFSRPAPLTPVPVAVGDILRTAVSLVQYDARARDMTFDIDIPPHVPTVLIVPDQLLQVLLNLLLNAVDAMGGSGAVRTGVTAPHGEVRITVSDSGHGIPAELIDRIFDPFFTTKPIGKGTGLGLSVSYGLLKKFNGRIDVESVQGEGSTFTIVLPVS